jgi:DNA adenine methylase
MTPETAPSVDDAPVLKAPFPWFGGKSRAASLIWARLGDVDTYNEPFAGSLAVLLGRPHAPRVETVNDLDCYLANFWRALQADPEQVAYYADYPVNETDLHARHLWLVNQAEFVASMKADPAFYDAKIAGWWVWGQCLWIGSGWCSRPDWTGRGCGARADRGVHAPGLDQKRPKLREGDWDGVSTNRRWQGGGQGGGSGVHAPRLSQQKPVLRGDSGADGVGVHRKLPSLSQGGNDRSGKRRALRLPSRSPPRLRRVRVCCGDWKRVLTPSVTTYVGLCGVFLDPPYSHDMRERCYCGRPRHQRRRSPMGDRERRQPGVSDRALRLRRGTRHAGDVGMRAVEGARRLQPDRAREREPRARERIWFSPIA